LLDGFAGRAPWVRGRGAACGPSGKEWAAIGILNRLSSLLRRGKIAGISPYRVKTLMDFETRAGIRFRDLRLLDEALTHRSFSSKNEDGAVRSNQRLEFLGDSVLGLVVSEDLYRGEPSWREGDLTKRKSILVSKTMLAERGRSLGVGSYLQLSDEELEAGGNERESALADALEAIIGALYVDGGLEAAEDFLKRQLLVPVSSVDVTDEHPNYKSELQEKVQALYRVHPRYRVTDTEGPDHDKIFTVEVTVLKRVVGVGTGRSKKDAEQMAAREALEHDDWDNRSHRRG
jgi:ribonuclease-3